MVAVGKDRIQPDRSVEVALGSADVTEIVLGYAPVKEDPTVGGVQMGKDVELADGVGVAVFGESLATPEHKDILVELGQAELGHRQQEQQG